MDKDYYLILGVNSRATLEEIRAAFRRRALKLHPDQSGLESGPFLELQEAYAVLSDRTRRRSYDQESRPVTIRRAARAGGVEPLIRQRARAGPFRQTEAERGIRGVAIQEAFQVHQLLFDEVFDRLWNHF